MHYSSTRMLFGTFLLIALFLVTVAACTETEPELVDADNGDENAEAVGDGSDSEAADASADDGEPTDAESDSGDGELEEAEGFSVGDTVRMGELVMHLHGVRWAEGGEFTSPDPGTRWLVADIELQNESDSPTSISSLLMFDLVDQDNRSRDIAIMADTQGSLDGELGAGRSLRGDMAWIVAEGQTAWELVFSPEIFGFGQAIYDISDADF